MNIKKQKKHKRKTVGGGDGTNRERLAFFIYKPNAISIGPFFFKQKKKAFPIKPKYFNNKIKMASYLGPFIEPMKSRPLLSKRRKRVNVDWVKTLKDL